MNLSQASKLFKLARAAINSAFTKEKIDLSSYKPGFGSKQGVFVTLTKQGRLRGCIGFPEPVLPLYEAVFQAARAAAFDDPRFPPVIQSELKDIQIEISVLTVPQLIKVDDADGYLSRIKIGEDGIIIKGRYDSGLLLPQVFIEYPCDVEGALEMTCQKAGLPESAWKDLKNEVYKFQAQIFSEEKGKIVEKKL